MKRISTVSKIRFLQDYVKKKHKKWHKEHPENIAGFRIGKKTKNGITSRYYSIIFHVIEKTGERNLDKNVIIPKYFTIKFPDGIRRKIKTDVEQTGIFKLQLGITDEVTSAYSDNYGSAGLFVKDSDNKVFVLTNYHVVAERMIMNRKYHYKRKPNQVKNDVKIISNNGNVLLGRFEEGIISHDIDVAFVQLPIEADQRMNRLPDNNRVKGRLATRPYPHSFIGKPLHVYSYHNRMGVKGNINDNSSILRTDNPKIYFEDIVQITPRITNGGDSGGIVLTPSFSVIGLVVGADDNYSYAIPLYKINDFKELFII